MAIFQSQNDTIEGDAIDVVSRLIVPTSAVKRSDVKKTMYGYYTDRNSHAEVIKTHTHPDDEDEEIRENTRNYHRTVGDALTCDKMKIYSDNRRPVKITHTEGASHTHGAQYANFRDYTIAAITTPLQNFEAKIAQLVNRPVVTLISNE